MTVESVDHRDRAAVECMTVVVSEHKGASGSWRWSVKRRRGTRLETVATSDRAYPRHQDALQAAEAFVSAEKTWDRAGRSDND